MEKTNIAILGASDQPQRYAHIAQILLQEKGFNPILINPYHKVINGIKCYSDLTKIIDPIHTLTIYVRPEISSKMKKEIINFKCERVIFNPGAENPLLYSELKKRGIEVEEACTLVLLNSGQF